MTEAKPEFTHLSGGDVPRMVDISAKNVTERTAVAVARVHLGQELSELLKESGSTKKRSCSANSGYWSYSGRKADFRIDPYVPPFTAFRSGCGY